MQEGGNIQTTEKSDFLKKSDFFDFWVVRKLSPSCTSILSVRKKETLSLIGGDLDINSDSPVMINQPSFIAFPNQPKLSSPSGQINLISAASINPVLSHFLINPNCLVLLGKLISSARLQRAKSSLRNLDFYCQLKADKSPSIII